MTLREYDTPNGRLKLKYRYDENGNLVIDNQKELDKMVKNCPCCGSEACIEVFPARKGFEANIQCCGCLLSMGTTTYDTPAQAAEAALTDWNKRV